ncbi:MAG: RiPP maturation radical SAM protein 1 [Planctomycetes bacterium]|nr:RiPP maturation radical SAM protein 1 [Planctomycetota bacterium]
MGPPVDSRGPPLPQRVLLLYPPFGSLSFPSIGLSLLKSALAGGGIECEIRYLNFDFLDFLVGSLPDRFALIDAIGQRNDFSVGDWLFNECVFSADLLDGSNEAYCRLLAKDGVPGKVIDQFREVKSLAPRFLDSVVERIDGRGYGVVGLHSIFNQTMAGLALSCRIRERFPWIPLVFGGPGLHSEMGVEILRHFPHVDYVVQGEADRTICDIVRALVSGREIARLPGVVSRQAENSVAAADGGISTTPIDRIGDMDSLPIPDFDDYFQRFAGRGYEAVLEPFLPIENSRGCWWGEKHHCTFCGLNGETMAFRAKSPQRVVEETRYLIDRYETRRLMWVDSILDHRYFRTVLPRLASEVRAYMFVEVRAAMKRPQVELLDDAGFRLLQPGVESLSTEVLQLMRKGTSYLQNVQFLKWARERDLVCFWSILYGFPGETEEFYVATADRIPALYHLFPPKTAVKVRADRFSPLFFRHRELGLSRVRPHETFSHVFPLDDRSLHSLAYHFEYDYADRPHDLTRRIESLIQGPVAEWNRRFFAGRASLFYLESPGRVLIRDTREEGITSYHLLPGATRDLYLACDEATSCERLAGEMDRAIDRRKALAIESLLGLDPAEIALDIVFSEARAQPDSRVIEHPELGSGASFEDVLESLRRSRLMTSESGRCLSLACRARGTSQFWQTKDSRRQDLVLANVAHSRRIELAAVDGEFLASPSIL